MAQKKDAAKAAPKKAAAKKTAAKAKPAAKKQQKPKPKTAPKKQQTPKPKGAAKPKAAPVPQNTGRRRKTIAQRTVDWKTGRTAFILRWFLMLPLAFIWFVFTFLMAGYSFTALVCACLIGVLLFYNICYLYTCCSISVWI